MGVSVRFLPLCGNNFLNIILALSEIMRHVDLALIICIYSHLQIYYTDVMLVACKSHPKQQNWLNRFRIEANI